MGGQTLIINTSYDVFLCKELPFGGRDDCTCVKIFSGIKFLKITSGYATWFMAGVLSSNAKVLKIR